MRLILAMLGTMLAGTLAARAETPAPIPLPSGQSVTLNQVIWPGEGAAAGERILRLRFLAPRIAKGRTDAVGAEAATDDLQYLCDHVGIRTLDGQGDKVDVIAITLMAKPVPFGTAAPDVTQYIDAFLPKGDHCEWEGL